MAAAGPASCTSRVMPVSGYRMPNRAGVTPNVERSEARRMSQAPASSHPPPTQ